MRETWVQSLGQEDPLEKGMAPVFLPGESCGQRSLVGYSPQGCKDSDMTEWLTLSLFKAHFHGGAFLTDLTLMARWRVSRAAAVVRGWMEGMLITLNPAWMSSEDFEFIPPPSAKELAPFWYHLTQSVICCRLLFAKPVNTLLESQVVSWARSENGNTCIEI